MFLSYRNSYYKEIAAACGRKRWTRTTDVSLSGFYRPLRSPLRYLPLLVGGRSDKLSCAPKYGTPGETRTRTERTLDPLPLPELEYWSILPAHYGLRGKPDRQEFSINITLFRSLYRFTLPDWSTERDLNPQSIAYKAIALPFGYRCMVFHAGFEPALYTV